MIVSSPSQSTTGLEEGRLPKTVNGLFGRMKRRLPPEEHFRIEKIQESLKEASIVRTEELLKMTIEELLALGPFWILKDVQEALRPYGRRIRSEAEPVGNTTKLDKKGLSGIRARDLKLSVRARNILHGLGILEDDPVEELARLNEEALLAAPNLGKITVREIRAKLARAKSQPLPGQVVALDRIVTLAGQAIGKLKLRSARRPRQAHILYNEATLAILSLLYYHYDRSNPKARPSPNVAVVDPLRRETLRAIALSAGFTPWQIENWERDYLVAYDPLKGERIDEATTRAEELIAWRLGVTPDWIEPFSLCPML